MQVVDVVVHLAALTDSARSQQLYISPGFAHGFCALSQITVLDCKCTQYYNLDQEDGIIWNNSEIGIKWPGIKLILSEKDRNIQGI